MNLDELIEKASNLNTPEVKPVATKTVNISLWLNIILIAIIGFGGYYLYTSKNDDNVDDDFSYNVAKVVQKRENEYSAYKAVCYLKAAELVESGTILNREHLKVNLQEMLENAKKASLGELDKLDNATLPEEDFTEEKSMVVKYLTEKAKGFEEASK